jgi:hypothetical protein
VLIQYHAYGNKPFAEALLRQLLTLPSKPLVIFMQHAVRPDIQSFMTDEEATSEQAMRFGWLGNTTECLLRAIHTMSFIDK